MRFEQPLESVAEQYPEFRVIPGARTSPCVSQDDIEAGVVLGRRLQARQVREIMNAVFVQPLVAAARVIVRTTSYLVREYKRNRDCRITIRELGALEDHQLRDIGIDRDHIVAVAEALANAKHLPAPADAVREPAHDEAFFEPLRAA